MGTPAAVAQAISFSAAVTSNFLWNRYWTYPDSRSKPVGRQAFQFFMVSLVGLIIRTIVFILVLPLTLLLAETVLPDGSNTVVPGENLGLAVAVIVVLLWNFLINRLWTYSDVQ